MSYLFMDESGCLGFDFKKDRTSKFFIITFLCVQHKNRLERVVKSIFKAMSEKERLRHRGVLHANKEHPKIRHKILHQIREKNDAQIMIIRLNKKKVYARLQDEKSVLYNYVTNILLDRIIDKKIISDTSSVHLVASRRETNRFLNENFKGYLEQQHNEKISLKVEIKTPAQEKCLQVVDFISWAVFRHYEHGDSSYYDVIKNMILEDKSLFG